MNLEQIEFEGQIEALNRALNSQREQARNKLGFNPHNSRPCETAANLAAARDFITQAETVLARIQTLEATHPTLANAQ